MSYYLNMSDQELVGHTLAIPDASELSLTLASRLRVQTKLRLDAEMRWQLAQERVHKLERDVRELKALEEKA